MVKRSFGGICPTQCQSWFSERRLFKANCFFLTSPEFPKLSDHLVQPDPSYGKIFLLTPSWTLFYSSLGSVTLSVDLLATALLTKPRRQLALTVRAQCSLEFCMLPTPMPMSFSRELLSIQSAPKRLHGATSSQMELLQDAESPFNSIPSVNQYIISHLSP